MKFTKHHLLKPTDGNDPGGENDPKFDDLGYPKKEATATPPAAEPPKTGEPPAGDPPAEPPKEQTPPKKDDKIGSSVSGYGDVPPKVDEEVTPPTDPPKEEIKLDFDLDTSKLPKEDAEAIRTLAKEEGLTEKQAKRLVTVREKEIADYTKANQEFEAEQKRRIQKTHNEWDAELRNDPDFGKEKFGHNVKLVDKVMKDFGSEFEKVLTERKGMMPPYIMRMLARVGAKLYATPNLDVGDPPPPPTEPENPDSHLDFYKDTLPKSN